MFDIMNKMSIKKFEFLEKIKTCRNTNEFRYKSIFKEGYCVFENVFSSLEMKKYQSVLNGMVRRLQPSEKPQFMF